MRFRDTVRQVGRAGRAFFTHGRHVPVAHATAVTARQERLGRRARPNRARTALARRSRSKLAGHRPSVATRRNEAVQKASTPVAPPEPATSTAPPPAQPTTASGSRRLRVQLACFAALIAITLLLAGPLFEQSKNIIPMDVGGITFISESDAPSANRAFTDVTMSADTASDATTIEAQIPNTGKIWIVIEQASTQEQWNYSDCKHKDDSSGESIRNLTRLSALPAWVDPADLWTDETVDVFELNSIGHSDVTKIECRTEAWESGGATTRIIRNPSIAMVTLLHRVSGPTPVLPTICPGPKTRQSIQLPIGAEILASKAEPDFVSSGNRAERVIPCEGGNPWNGGIGGSESTFERGLEFPKGDLRHYYQTWDGWPLHVSTDAAFIGWPGAIVSMTDQQAQEALAPRGLLAGAGLGVAGQLLFDILLSTRRPRAPWFLQRLSIYLAPNGPRTLGGFALTILGLSILWTTRPAIEYIWPSWGTGAADLLGTYVSVAATVATAVAVSLLGTAGIILYKHPLWRCAAALSTIVLSISSAVVCAYIDGDLPTASIFGFLLPAIILELTEPISRSWILRVIVGIAGFAILTTFSYNEFYISLPPWLFLLASCCVYAISGILIRWMTGWIHTAVSTTTIATCGMVLIASTDGDTDWILGLAVIFGASTVAGLYGQSHRRSLTAIPPSVQARLL